MYGQKHNNRIINKMDGIILLRCLFPKTIYKGVTQKSWCGFEECLFVCLFIEDSLDDVSFVMIWWSWWRQTMVMLLMMRGVIDDEWQMRWHVTDDETYTHTYRDIHRNGLKNEKITTQNVK